MKLDLNIIIILMFVLAISAQVEDSRQNNYYYRRHFRCPAGWVQRCNRCFLYVDRPMQWVDAQYFCRSRGADLVTIRDWATNYFMYRIVRYFDPRQRSIWIGANDRRVEDRFEWSDGTPASRYSFRWFAPGEPDDEAPGQDCVEMTTRGRRRFLWRDHFCEDEQPFICQANACYEGQFICDNGRCVTKYAVCDKVNDCGDNSDERDCNHCGGKLEGTNGTFTSPRYPKFYPSDSDCSWKISVPLKSKVELTFDSIALEPGFDYIDVYDGPTLTSKLMTRVIGIGKPRPLLTSGNQMLVRFISDESIENRGFLARYRAVTDNVCGGKLKVGKGHFREITSPNYPLKYPTKAKCIWEITTDADNVISIRFIDFETEPINDVVDVKDGTESAGKLVARLSGAQTGKTFISTGINFSLKFITNHAVNMRGFKVAIRGGCYLELNVSKGVISSPGFGYQNYPNKLDCTWKVNEPSGKEFAVMFHFFDTEQFFDLVEVNDNRTGVRINRYSGELARLPSQSWILLTKTSKLEFKFTSDYSYNKKGFRATFSIGCPKLEVPDYGSISTAETYYGVKVTYKCVTGYRLVNGVTKTCLFGGRWTDGSPKCEVINCGHPGLIENGELRFTDGFDFNSTATYSCFGAYRLAGTSVRKCQENGTWTGSLPKCIEVGCGDPGTPANGERSTNSTKVGTSMSFKCNEGHRLMGLKSITCRRDGKWTGAVPTCKAIYCTTTPPPVNGRYILEPNQTIPDKISYGQKIRFACNPGYHMKGSMSLICQANGELNDTVPVCLDKDECLNAPCRGPGAVCVNTFGSFNCVCKPGYQKAKGQKNTCEDINECSMKNGGCDQNCTNKEGSFECSCREGYYLYDGSEGIVPEATVNRTCLGVRCPAPPALANGTRPISSSRYPFRVESKCNVGFLRLGPKEVQCTKNGNWSGMFATCDVVNCGDPGTSRNAEVNITDDSNYRSEITYQCLKGHIKEGGSYQQECLANETHAFWTGDPLVCKKISCGRLPTIVNGEVAYLAGTLFGDKASYECNSGYKLSGGSHTRTCTAQGVWAGSEPYCKATPCPDPGFIQNGKRSGQTMIGDTVTYSCIHGYTLVGNPNRTCIFLNGKGNTWSGVLPNCKDSLPPSFGHTCPNNSYLSLPKGEATRFLSWNIPVATDNSGNVTVTSDLSPPQNLSPGATTITYTAVDLDGNTANCTFTITLEDKEPPVTECPKNINISSDLPVIAYWGNGYAKDNTGIASIVFYPPNGTKFLSNTKNNVTMVATDLYGNQASCLMELVVKGCGCERSCDIQPDHGSANCHVNLPPISCNIFCDANYTIADKNANPYPTLHCPGGNWTSPSPGCALKKPVQLCSIFYARVAYLNSTDPAIPNVPKNHALFLLDYLRKQSLPECNNTKLLSDRIEEDFAEFGLKKLMLFIKVTFASGFPTKSATQALLDQCAVAVRQHLLNNEPNATAAMPPFIAANYTNTCQKIEVSSSYYRELCCDGTAKNCCPANHVFTQNSHLASSFCYACTPGMYYDAATKNCKGCPMNTFQNVSGSASCEKCPSGSGTLRTSSKSCTAHCEPGTFSYDGFGPICRPCPLNEYQSSSQATECLKCPNGTTTRSTGAKNVSECIVPCDPGYISSDGFSPCEPCRIGTYQPNAGRVVCYPCPGGGKFGGNAAAVSVAECPSNDSCYASPCQSNGTCLQGEFTYKCICTEGYTGTDCEIDIDDCAPGPCLNGGNCTDLINAYQCTCPPGFTGVNCEINIDECASQPCKNGGECIDGVNSVTCNCRAGFTGQLCEQDINECLSKPCKNGATCLDLINRYLCICAKGYEGTNCQNETNECMPKPCRNNATCVDLVNDFRCDCRPGFAGRVCEVDINECLMEPCANNGTCLDKVNDYQCVCQPGYAGKNCTIDIDECAASPCANNASCTDLVNDYSCTCLPGFTGRRCEIDIDECALKPCANGARCVDQVNGFKCMCLPGFEGSRCENETNECNPNPCVYGDCVDLKADYSCNCTVGFTGKNCDVDIDECAVVPCQNYGNCTDLVAGYNCSCQAGFTGVNCEINIDDCSPDPCNGNAFNCTDQVDDYFCACKPGYKGKSCEIEIDYCTPNPCMYNSTCSNVKDSASFKCNCTDGYQGRTCESEINECASNPCKNGGVCKDQIAGFTCTCPSGFTGLMCETNIDDCVTGNGIKPCLNGGICVDHINSFTCKCPITHIGKRCEKAKSPRFDLRFQGGSGSYLKYSNYSSTSALTVASWVRYLGKSAAGTFLVLANMVNSSYYENLVEIKETLSRVTPSSASPLSHPFTKTLNDGFWHHVIITINSADGKVQIYKDKQVVYDSVEPNMVGRNLFNPKGVLVLGQEITSSGSVKSSSFVGEIGQVGVWNRVLNAEERLALTANCSTNLTDTLRSWIQLSASKGPNVTIVEPTTCGSNTCPPSFTGQFCETEIDKEPPKVVYCPNVTKIVTPSRLSSVSWREPTFTDNKIVATVVKSHRPNSFMSWGDYIVTYTAADLSGNAVSCTFELYIMRYDCPSLKAPRNGAKFCGSWDYGRFCDAKCYPNHAFAVRHPPYYSCGQSGTWSHGPPTYPENPENLLPACAAMASASKTTTNRVSYGASSCNQQFIAQFRREFEAKILQIQKYFPICGSSCDFSNIGIKCDSGSRKRRSVGGSSATITVDFPVNTTNGENYTAEVQKRLKNGQIDLTVSVNNETVNSTESGLSTTVKTECAHGSILNPTKTSCIICPAGTYHNVTGSECLSCPVGTYQNSDRSTNCTMCPSGTTTFNTASNDSSACREICSSGSFFNMTANRCDRCPEGFYQNSTGQMQCDYCPSGTTSNLGAKSATDCFVKCGLGSQLVSGDSCELCPRGSYRDATNQSGCVSCPVTGGVSTTTYIVGARNVSACKAICPRGKEVAKEPLKCMDCQTGTYRNDVSSPYCMSCPSGQTTKLLGSSSSSSCIPVQNSVKEQVAIRFTNEIWTSKLNDENSTEFRSMAGKVSTAVDTIYAGNAGFLSAKVRQFRNGSVIALMDLIFSKSMSDPLNSLRSAISTGSVGSLKVDSTYKLIDHCRFMSKCGQNEVCKSNATHGYCECIKGYYKPSASKQCDLDCEPTFCLNGGTCERGPNGRTCRCKSGYSGTQCKTESNKKIALIVGCTIAALLVVIIIGILIWKQKQQKYYVNKGIHLDNTASARNSPQYPLKSFTNPSMNDYDTPLDSKASTPSSVHAFTNKAATDSVLAEEGSALNKETEKDL